MAARHVDFKRQFAGEGNPEHPRRQASDGAGGDRHMRQGFRRQVDIVGQAGEHVARFWPTDRSDRPLLGDRGQINPQIRPFGLQPFLQPIKHGGGGAGGGGHVEMVLGQTRGHPVILDHAVIAEHQAVARPADRQFQPIVGIDAVQKLGRVGAFDIDLAQGTGVEQADRVARRPTFARHRLGHGLAGARIVPGPHPLADMFERGAMGALPGVHRGGSHRLEQGADGAPGVGANRHRRQRRAKGGGADRRNFGVPGRGQ